MRKLANAQLLHHILQQLPKVRYFDPVGLPCSTHILVGPSVLSELLRR